MWGVPNQVVLEFLAFAAPVSLAATLVALFVAFSGGPKRKP